MAGPQPQTGAQPNMLDMIARMLGQQQAPAPSGTPGGQIGEVFGQPGPGGDMEAFRRLQETGNNPPAPQPDPSFIQRALGSLIGR